MSARQVARIALLLLLAGSAWGANPPPACQFTVAPQRCVLLRQGERTCVDLKGSARRTCEREYAPPLRCHGRDLESCQALSAAQLRCDALDGAARRNCVQPELPPCRAFTRTAQCRR